MWHKVLNAVECPKTCLMPSQKLGLTRPPRVKRQFLQHVFRQLEEGLPADLHPAPPAEGGAVLGDPDWAQVRPPQTAGKASGRPYSREFR